MAGGRRRALLAVAAGAVAGLAVGVTVAGSSSSGFTRIHLVEREGDVHFVDLGKHGLTVGDRNSIRSDVLDPQGHVVGRFDFDCDVTGVGRHLGGVCHGALTLAGGQIAGESA